ncbi:MAG: MBL fold metallo-hydrolase [Nitrosomonas sp.]|nr:MBL fold metallo-hydrolase [Nitrosomonas sp.]MDP1949757.1 MBL fold metallo-hydrolase [Nitrosomonas sp.]
MTLPLTTDYDYGISAVDAEYYRPQRAAIHLIVESGIVALVDTGTTFSIPGVISVLKEKNLALENVAYVFLTHIHLDHAGGASECMRNFPNAKLVVHPRGARHMADPARLIAGVIAVYGEAEFKRIYGEIYPIEACRIIEAPDKFRIDLNGRPLLLLDTPGHARHHYSIYDEQSNTFFTGDTFGVSYREFDVNGLEFIFPTTTPVQFDPVAAHASIDKIMQYNPDYAFLTHYSRIGNLPRHADEMHNLIDTFVAMAKKVSENQFERHARLTTELTRLLLKKLDSHGCPLPHEAMSELLQSDIKLNAQGLEIWLDQSANRL